MMTTVQALVWSGILTFLMLLVASAFCAKLWEPGGQLIAFGNREGAARRSGWRAAPIARRKTRWKRW